MNESGDISLTHSSGTPDTRPCSIISIIPNIGMSSCRGRAEAFARRLSSKLRTLGSQTDDEDEQSPEDEPIINGVNTNTWVTAHDSKQTVTDLQPLRQESEAFFDFDCEDLESPGSPVDECEYLRLIETASNTPHNSTTESGYVCASAASSHSSTDGPYFDASSSSTKVNTVTTQQPKRSKLPVSELPLYVEALKINGSAEHLTNGFEEHEEHEKPTDNLEQKNSNSNKNNNSVQIASAPPPANQNGTTNTPPITGPDEAQDSVNVQEQILSELQQESEKYVANLNGYNQKTSANDEDVTDTIAEDSNKEAIETTAPHETVHPILNGHAENGDEVLEVVVTEIEQNLKEENEITVAVEDPIDEKAIIEQHDQDEVDAALCPPVRLDISVTQEQMVKNEQEIVVDTTKVIDTTNAIDTISAIDTTNTTKTSNNNVNNHSNIDTTDDEDDCRPQRVRRCSSLKTGKTPPGTPGRKKIVRFADVLGLDLADVKTFLDEIPTIPKSAFEDLEILELEPPIQLGPRSDKLLMPLFQQPGGLATFLDIVREKQVSLENAAITDSINQTITGSVRVRNLDFNKSVHIRYSLDGWRSFADLQANYVQNSCDGFSDKFTFILFGNSLHIGQRLEFAVRFQCKGQQFWDNNYGANYCFQCLPTSTTIVPIPAIHSAVPLLHHNTMVNLLSPAVSDAWCSSFY